jgi:putative membrane protein
MNQGEEFEMCKLILGVICATAFLGACTTAETSNTNQTANTKPMAQVSPAATPARGVAPRHDDPDWVMKVAHDGMEEVELGQLAAKKATNPDVKRFAQRMVTDHSKVNAELKQLATTKGIKLPDALDDDQKAMKDKLSKLSGAEFDREYMSMMVAGHDKAVAAFQGESREGSDAELKAFATKTLPTLLEHQTLAKETRDKLK